MRCKLWTLVFVSTLALLLVGCTSESPTLEEKTPESELTPEAIVTTPTAERTEETVTPEKTPEIKIPEVKLVLRDSSVVISESTIDKLFTITHDGGESILAAKLKIEVYDKNYEMVDSLEYKSSSKSFEGEKLKSTAFFDEKLDSGDTIAILETPKFFNLRSHAVLNVKVIYIPAGEPLVEGSIEVI